MPIDHETILKHLFAARQRLSAVAWLIVRDAHAAQDILQNVALKPVTREVSFEHDGALLSRVTVSAKREAIDWLRKRKNETLSLEPDVLELLDHAWRLKTSQPESGHGLWCVLDGCETMSFVVQDICRCESLESELITPTGPSAHAPRRRRGCGL